MGIRKIFSGGLRIFKQELLLLFFAISDNRTPMYAKFASLLALFYLISPVDFLPDFIPFIGLLDDLVIVPLLLKLAYRLLPLDVMQTAQIKASKNAGKVKWAIGLLLAAIVVIMTLFIVSGVYLFKAMIAWFQSDSMV